MTDRELPHGGTLRDLRIQIAKHAAEGEQVFIRTLADSPPGPLSDSDRELNLLAHGTSFYGWALVSVLRFIEDRFGAQAADQAGAVVQNIGVDGDFGDLSDDIAAAVTAEVTL